MAEPTQDQPTPIWEDGIGDRDADARVLWQDETEHAPDPQAVRYGEGRCQVTVQATIGGPRYRRRPYVDIRWHEGLRPSYMRLTPEEARRIAALFLHAAERASQESAPNADAGLGWQAT